MNEIANFRSSISTNLLAHDDFVDWEAVDNKINSSNSQIKQLQNFVDIGDLSENALRKELDAHPNIYPILLDLLAFSSTGTQVEKWGLPQTIELGSQRTQWVAEQLKYIGIDRLLAGDPNVQSLVRVAEVYKDSYRRRFRAGKKLEDRVKSVVANAIKLANETLPDRVSINPSSLNDQNIRRSLPYVLAMGNRPIAGIATVFQNQSGGRQQRDLSATYPSLQQRMAERGMALILIADGQGLREASDRTLSALFDGVKYPMTLIGAADGLLENAIIAAGTAEIEETLDQSALNLLIGERLAKSLAVLATDLPVGSDRARLALAQYATGRARTALKVSISGDEISWLRSDLIEKIRKLKWLFSAREAINIFANLLNLEIRASNLDGGTVVAVMSAPAVQPFAESLHVRAGTAALDVSISREIGRWSMEQAPGSPVAIYLTATTLSDEQLQSHRKSQVFLPTNIICISVRVLEIMAQAANPLVVLMNFILAQSDLTKVSPYILSNATPPRMFYGREIEAATALGTIATNSVAILGSRRIGKTSLIRRLQSELEAAHFQPYFGDCQTVRTWSDFAELAKKKWDVDLPDDFRPAHLGKLIEQLQSRGDGPVVIILDEIDQLLDWDQRHDDDSVPEAFFRACRSISQEGNAQFVFAGERRIANRLWDPQSPHWNFCRQLQLTQLDEIDARSLLSDPLKSMNIKIFEEDRFNAVAWERTSGHPQIVQFLGDRLVRELDQRIDRNNLSISVNEIELVTNTFEYAEHYLDTYWGQASRLERRISEIISTNPMGINDIGSFLSIDGLTVATDEILAAVRMLHLYGISLEIDGKIALRATWFPDALAHFGPSAGVQEVDQ